MHSWGSYSPTFGSVTAGLAPQWRNAQRSVTTCGPHAGIPRPHGELMVAGGFPPGNPSGKPYPTLVLGRSQGLVVSPSTRLFTWIGVGRPIRGGPIWGARHEPSHKDSRVFQMAWRAGGRVTRKKDQGLFLKVQSQSLMQRSCGVCAGTL